MTATLYSIEDVLVIKPSDDIRIRTLIEFRKVLEDAIVSESTKIAIDLKDIRFIDSSGIGLLLNFAKRLIAEEKMVYLVNPKKELADVLEMTSINELIPIYATENEFRMKVIEA